HPPRVEGNLLTGYQPPWVRAALAEITPDVCGFLLGEIPAELRAVLSDVLRLRACPRTFVLHVRREGEGVALSLSLNVDKAGAELLLLEDLERWRAQGPDVLKARFPAVTKESAELALLGQTLKTMRWG